MPRQRPAGGNGRRPEGDTRPIFSRAQLQWMGGGALAFVLPLCVIVFFTPAYAEHEFAGFAFCLVVAFALSVFFFVLWPREVQLASIPVPWTDLKVPVSLAGPAALWVILLFVLSKAMPVTGSHGEFFTPGAVAVPYHTDLRIKHDRDLIRCEVFRDPTKLELKGVFVQFAPGKNEVDADLVHPNQEPVRVRFRRGAGEMKVVAPAEKEKRQ